MRPQWVVANLVLMLMLLAAWSRGVKAITSDLGGHETKGRDFIEKALLQLAQQRRQFLDGFSNGTAAIQRDLGFEEPETSDATGEGRGRRKKLRQMNRTLMAIVMAYTLKFMFLIPTFVGTLILLKFTTALAGFFYALFAAVLGLDHNREH